MGQSPEEILSPDEELSDEEKAERVRKALVDMRRSERTALRIARAVGIDDLDEYGSLSELLERIANEVGAHWKEKRRKRKN